METTSSAELKETGHSPDRIHAGRVYGLRRYIDAEGQGEPYELCTAQPIEGPHTILLIKNLETSGLTLRSRRRSDKDFTLSLWGDRENGEYMSDPVRENMDGAYLKCVDEVEDSPEGYYLLTEREANTMPIGTCRIFPESRNYDTGYCVAEEYRREGLGTEMADAILRWMKAKGGKSAMGEVADGNLPSITLLRRFGFTENGKTRYKRWGEETCFDAHYYKLNLDGLPISLQC